jgi:hypothetical protein
LLRGLVLAGGGRPAATAEDCFGGVVEFDADGLGVGQEPASEMEQVFRIRLLDCVEVYDVGPEALDGFPLVSVLGFNVVDVGCLGTELRANGVQCVAANGTRGC